MALSITCVRHRPNSLMMRSSWSTADTRDCSPCSASAIRHEHIASITSNVRKVYAGLTTHNNLLHTGGKRFTGRKSKILPFSQQIILSHTGMHQQTYFSPVLNMLKAYGNGKHSHKYHRYDLFQRQRATVDISH